MTLKLRRFSLVEDCLLALFALAIAAVLIATLAGSFSWPAVFALMMVPTAFLATHQRHRAASLYAMAALIVGARDIVPPVGSFSLDAYGMAAVAIMAAAATLAIGVARLAHRHAVPRVSSSRA